MALAQGNGRAVASGRPFDRQPDARGKKGSRRRRRPRHRAEGTPQPCLGVTGAISSAVHPPCRSDCVVRTLKLGPVRPVPPAITARFRHRLSFTRGRSLVRSQPGPLRDGAGQRLQGGGWPRLTIAFIRQNPPQVDLPLAHLKVLRGTRTATDIAAHRRGQRWLSQVLATAAGVL